MIRRREFIAGLGSAAAWPMVARTQQPPLPLIAYLEGAIANEKEGLRGIEWVILRLDA